MMDAQNAPHDARGTAHCVSRAGNPENAHGGVCGTAYSHAAGRL
jgi:hypothetical protein